MEKSCLNCVYEKTAHFNLPCKVCSDEVAWSHWEASEEYMLEEARKQWERHIDWMHRDVEHYRVSYDHEIIRNLYLPPKHLDIKEPYYIIL